MEQISYVDSIQDQTERALWEVGNIVDCVPDSEWDAVLCDMPLWKHIYHMLHSLDMWFINPRDNTFVEPSFHKEGMNDLDILTENGPSKKQMLNYYQAVAGKVREYVCGLSDNDLLTFPENCEYDKFTLILAQFRHLHTHMGMIMGYIVMATNKWPRVVGLESGIPHGEYEKFV